MAPYKKYLDCCYSDTKDEISEVLFQNKRNCTGCKSITSEEYITSFISIHIIAALDKFAGSWSTKLIFYMSM